jgi:hypothetical protein
LPLHHLHYPHWQILKDKSFCATLSHIPCQSSGKATPLPKQVEELWQEVLGPVRTHLPFATSQGHPGCTGTAMRVTCMFPQSIIEIWREKLQNETQYCHDLVTVYGVSIGNRI